MKRNWKMMWGVAAFVAALLVTPLVGFSQQGRPQGPPPPEGGFHGGPGNPHRARGGAFGLLRDLNLSEAQKAEIKRIHDSFAESTRALREQMRALHKRNDLLNGGAFDEAAVRAAAQARASVQVELDVARARMMSQVFAVLTAEQKAQLSERRQRFEQRRRERKERRAGATDN